jgi:adenosylhomocysteine nucleosidase
MVSVQRVRGRLKVLAPCKVAIVAALEREVWPFVKDWPVERREHDGRDFKFFVKETVSLVCGGIGSEAARRAAEAIVALYHPALLVSAGFAGGLDSTLSVGDTLIPRHVIDSRDGSRTEHSAGEGVLVSFEDVADVEQKAKLNQAFGAHAVDMEAAAVARCAAAHDLQFLAIKVVSDSSGSQVLPIMRFVGSDGRFHAVSFVLHIALRPWLWSRVFRLARDSAKAAGRLCDALGRDSIFHLASSQKVLTH